jgi:glutamate formiminotransferase / 5-formyltetrahydrofolate cyclo-ligase
MLESVPNISEGRDSRVIAAIADAYAGAGAIVLDTHTDGDHNRSVHTLIGDEQELVAALVAGVQAASEQIDLRQHQGIHPRVGAADVVPVVALAPGDGDRARAAAFTVARRVGEDLGLPVFLYGDVGGGRRPAFFRRGGPDELQRRIDAGELTPDFGPERLSPSAGAVLVGARAPLVAFNIVLDTESLAIVQEVASAVRESGGGLAGVQALGLRLGASGRMQVSMNLIDLERAVLHEVVARVAEEAGERGAQIVEGELVGLLPAKAVVAAAEARGVDAPLEPSGMPTARALEAAASAFALPELAADRLIEYHLALVGRDEGE